MTNTRRARERAQRHQLIITTARRIAEAEGWEAVTTRRLADEIEYSQPVLYGHFADKNAIVDAVALEGIGELAEVMRSARLAAGDEPRAALAAVATAYLEFAEHNPATFDAMFELATGLTFGDGAPEVLRNAFAELSAVFTPLAGDRDAETFTEIGWAALHGLVSLQQRGRLRPGLAPQRFAILIDQLTARP